MSLSDKLLSCWDACTYDEIYKNSISVCDIKDVREAVKELKDKIGNLMVSQEGNVHAHEWTDKIIDEIFGSKLTEELDDWQKTVIKDSKPKPKRGEKLI